MLTDPQRRLETSNSLQSPNVTITIIIFRFHTRPAIKVAVSGKNNVDSQSMNRDDDIIHIHIRSYVGFSHKHLDLIYLGERYAQRGYIYDKEDIKERSISVSSTALSVSFHVSFVLLRFSSSKVSRFKPLFYSLFNLPAGITRYASLHHAPSDPSILRIPERFMSLLKPRGYRFTLGFICRRISPRLLASGNSSG